MTLSSTSTAHLLATRTGEGDGMCQASAGATVKDQPESVSWINRNSVKDQVTPDRPASPETRQHTGAPGRNRTCDTRFRKPLLYPLSYEGEGWRNHGGKPAARSYAAPAKGKSRASTRSSGSNRKNRTAT